MMADTDYRVILFVPAWIEKPIREEEEKFVWKSTEVAFDLSQKLQNWKRCWRLFCC